jgi:hypothetical protein
VASGDAPGDGLGDPLGDAVGEALGDALGEALGDALGDRSRDRTTGSVPRIVGERNGIGRNSRSAIGAGELGERAPVGPVETTDIPVVPASRPRIRSAGRAGPRRRATDSTTMSPMTGTASAAATATRSTLRTCGSPGPRRASRKGRGLRLGVAGMAAMGWRPPATCAGTGLKAYRDEVAGSTLTVGVRDAATPIKGYESRGRPPLRASRSPGMTIPGWKRRWSGRGP